MYYSVYNLLLFIFHLALGYWLYLHLPDILAEREASKDRKKAVSSRSNLIGSADQVRSFYELYTKGVLTAEEYETRKREIITRS